MNAENQAREARAWEEANGAFNPVLRNMISRGQAAQLGHDLYLKGAEEERGAIAKHAHFLMGRIIAREAEADALAERLRNVVDCVKAIGIAPKHTPANEVLRTIDRLVSTALREAGEEAK